MMCEAEQRIFTLVFPTRVNVSKNKIKSLNLNIYRNLHYFESNFQKRALKSLIKKDLQDIPKLGRIKLKYTVFQKTNRIIDTMNVGVVCNKYFEDALVEFGIIKEDNYNYILDHSFCFGGKRNYAQVEVTITEIETIEQINQRKGKDMRILLDETDFKEAVENYVNDQLAIEGDRTITISVVKGAIQAEVAMLRDDETPTEDTLKPARKSRGGRPKGSKNKPKPEEQTEPEKETDDVAKTDAKSSSDSDSSGSDKPAAEKSKLFDESNEKDEKQPSETKTSDDTKTEPASDKKSKNLFADSDEESSTEDAAAESEANDDGEKKTVIAKKKASIFDED